MIRGNDLKYLLTYIFLSLLEISVLFWNRNLISEVKQHVLVTAELSTRQFLIPNPQIIEIISIYFLTYNFTPTIYKCTIFVAVLTFGVRGACIKYIKLNLFF